MKNKKEKVEIVSMNSSYLPALRGIFLQGRIEIDPVSSKTISLDDFDKETFGEEILVAVNGNRPIGFLSIWLPDNFIHHLYVEQLNRGMGVGQALLYNALQILAGGAQLKCFVSNNKALAFYAKQGFEIKETVESELGDYHVLVLMKSRN